MTLFHGHHVSNLQCYIEHDGLGNLLRFLLTGTLRQCVCWKHLAGQLSANIQETHTWPGSLPSMCVVYGGHMHRYCYVLRCLPNTPTVSVAPKVKGFNHFND